MGENVSCDVPAIASTAEQNHAAVIEAQKYLNLWYQTEEFTRNKGKTKQLR